MSWSVLVRLRGRRLPNRLRRQIAEQRIAGAAAPPNQLLAIDPRAGRLNKKGSRLMTDIRKDLETAAVAMADFEGGSIFRETLLNAIAALDAIELAYGLLWRCAVDRRTAGGST
jgi:hypothetical protein